MGAQNVYYQEIWVWQSLYFHVQTIVCKQLLIANIDRRVTNNDYCFQTSCYAVFYLIARTELVDDASSDHSFSSL